MRVVLVDDMDNFRSTLRAFLRVSDIDVVGEADNAMDAYRVVGEQRPDVVVLDLDLGEGTGGLELLPRLRETSPSTAVVVVSAYSDPKVSEGVLAAGADAFIPKRSVQQVVVSIRSLVDDESVSAQRRGPRRRPPID